MKVALLAGATGLIGNEVLKLLLDDPEYHQVKVLTRRPIDLSHAKLTTIIGDLDSLQQVANELKADTVFCCLGTTMKKAGTKEAFRKVDFTYPLEIASLTHRLGAKQFLLVSALGADSSSSIYYNKIKGEVEEAIGKIGFTTFHIFRPSLLLGDRNETRPGEEAAKVVYQYLGFLIPAKYKGIEASRVARAMVHLARQEEDGKHIHESIELQAFGK